MDSMEKRRRVYGIFQGISQTYDGANRRISLGLEQSWEAGPRRGCSLAGTGRRRRAGRLLRYGRYCRSRSKEAA